MRPAILTLTGFAALAAAGCITALEPDVGDLMEEECANVDSDPSRTISFSEDLLRDLFNLQPNTCKHCHDPSEPTPIGYEYGGFDMSSYSGVLAGGVNSGADMVVPGRPCESFLYLKLTPSPPVGSRMPWTGPFYSEADMAILTDWIAEGADDN